MNATKLAAYLSRATALSVLAALLGFALNPHAPALFALAASLSVLLVAIADYAPRTLCTAAPLPARNRSAQPLALAA